MRIDNEQFALANLKASKEPRYAVKIAFDDVGLFKEYFTSHADTLVPVGASVTHGVLQQFTGTSQKLNPEEARSEIGSMTVRLVDKDGAITALINTYLDGELGLRHKFISFYVGESGLTQWSDYVQVQTQIITEVQFSEGVYILRCSDIQRETRKKIFDPFRTTLSRTVDATQLHIPVFSTTGLELIEHGASYSDAPNRSVNYLRIEDEVVRVIGTQTHPTDGLSFTADQRGALGTKPAEHAVDENTNADSGIKVEEYVYLEMPAVKLAYALLTGELYGQGAATLPDNWHLGIDPAFIRLSEFTGIGADLWDPANDSIGKIFRFEGLKSHDGKRFIEKELYLPVGLFSPVHNDGGLGLRRLTKILTDAAFVELLDETAIVEHSELTHDMGAVRNLVQIQWNWNAQQERLTRRTNLIDEASITVHKSTELKTFQFKGVHGSRHTLSTIEILFDSLRDRFAGPALRMTVTCLPRFNYLEVGDVVRVRLANVRDYNSNASLDRSFEIQSVRIDWITGRVTFELFSSAHDSALIPIGDNTQVLSDAFYTSEGTDLSTYLSPAQFEDIGGVGHIKADATLPGGDNATDPASIYYLDRDLDIDPGVTLTTTGNVQLRVRGHVTWNGSHSSKGQGRSGVAAGPVGANHITGTPGFIGTTQAGGTVTWWDLRDPFDLELYWTSGCQPLTKGQHDVMPLFELSYDRENEQLLGLPKDLRGSSGGPGGHPISGGNTDGIYFAGGAGGSSGGGLITISRGMSFGAGGGVDTSGSDGLAGSLAIGRMYGGGGAGGAPGGWLIILDGANANIPVMSSKFAAQHGTAPVSGNPLPDFYPYEPGHGATVPVSPYCKGTEAIDLAQSAYRIQFVPSDLPAEEDDPSIPPDVTGFVVSQNGDVAVFQWDLIEKLDILGYDIRYGPRGNTSWEDATPLTKVTKGTQITSAAVPPGDWTFFIKAVDRDGNYSANAVSRNLIFEQALDIIQQRQEAPAWIGRLSALRFDDATNYVRISASTSLNIAGPMTIEFWAIPGTGAGPFVEYTDGIALYGPVVWQWNSADKFYANFVDITGISHDITVENVFLESRWYHCVALYDGQDIVLFVDGKEVARANEGTFVPRTSVDLYLSHRPISFSIQYSDHVVDMVRFYNRALAITEVAEHAAGIYKNEVGLALHFDFEEDGGASVVDKSGNNNTGTLINAPQRVVGRLGGNFVKHWTGVLLPADQKLASEYTNFEMFDIFVPNPVPQCIYEAGEFDLGFDDTVRVWGDINSQLGPGRTGLADPKLEVDHRKEAEAYDGFEPWTIGNINARYIKHLLVLDTSQGVAKILDFHPTADSLERTEKQTNVTVPPGGLSINFAKAFHNGPYIDVDVVSSSALFSTISNITSTGFTVNIWDSSGTDVGGTINWKATGV